MKFTKLDHGGYSYAVNAVCGEPFDCFFSFVRWHEDFWSVHRRHVMFEPHLWPDNYEDYVSDIYVTRWEEDKAGNLVPSQSEAIGRGNDPRICMVDNRPIALFRGSIHAQHSYYLYDLKSCRLLDVDCPEPWFEYGKNWSPFENAGSMGAVHGFSPLRFMAIDPANGTASTLGVHDKPYNLKAPHDQFNMFRGGSNAVKLGNKLIGLGHCTMQAWRHYPFIWYVGLNGELKTSLNDDFGPLQKAGYGIIDPTSICEDENGAHWIGICASERDWFYSQNFCNFLIPGFINGISSDEPEIRVNTNFLSKNTYTIQIIAAELESPIGAREVKYGARQSNEDGFIVVGPFSKLPSGSYCIHLRYKSIGEKENIGYFDYGYSIPGYYREVKRVDLPNSYGIVVIQTSVFDWDPSDFEVFTLRVHSTGDANTIVYDAKVVRIL